VDPRGPVAPPLTRVGRDGRLHLRFARRDGRTVVAGTRSTVPLQALAPLAFDDPAAVVSMLTPTGGLAGGDRLEVEAVVEAGAHGCLTTPAATKVYRTLGPAAEQEVCLVVGAGATLEWVPDHTIVFGGAAFRQRITARLGPGARLILVDAFAAGRVARGEAWRFDRLESVLSVRDDAGWLLWDRWALAGSAGWAGLGLAEGCPYFATVAVFGPGDPALARHALDAALAGAPGVSAGVGVLGRGGVVGRVLAREAPALLAALEAAWAAARRHALDLPPLALRKG
jgi:urease accessory protein